MQEIIELFATVPPNFILDHYLHILSHLVNSYEEDERFTVSDLKNSILAKVSESDNPFYRSTCLLAFNVSEKALDHLAKAGLIVKEDSSFYRSKTLSRFYRFVRSMKSSVKRCVAWTVWYYYRNGVNSIDKVGLISVLSYEDKVFLSELDCLSVWKEKSWRKVLKKSNGTWRLATEPHTPSKPILLSHIFRRMYSAILSDTRDVFVGREIIEKIRQLEFASFGRVMREFGFKESEEKWYLDEKTVDCIKGVMLESLSIVWPFFGIVILRNPSFKLENRTLYVDLPNSFIWDFLEKVGALSAKYKNKLERLYKEVKKLSDSFNEDFENSYGKWLYFTVRRERFGDKPFGIRVNVKWKDFFSFLEGFAKSDLPLKEKYTYLFNCRAPSLRIAIKSDLERTQNDVKALCTNEINQIRQELIDFVNQLKMYRDALVKVSRRKTVPTSPVTLMFFPEMISTLEAFTSLVENGAIPSCYREMRKVLENLAWVVFDDLLFYKMNILRSGKYDGNVPFLPFPYRSLSREWYDWASQQGLILRHWGDLKHGIKSIVESLNSYLKKRKCNWGKKLAEKELLKNFSYPLFMLCTGFSVPVPEELREVVPSYKTQLLTALARRDLENFIRKLKGSPLTLSDKKFVESLLETLQAKATTDLVPAYPSNQFVLNFIGKTFDYDILKQYDEKSHFVHSYFTSWHIFPFSSLLEFKILQHELSKFAAVVLRIVSLYCKELFKIRLNE